jgi:hypothetical protein
LLCKQTWIIEIYSHAETNGSIFQLKISIKLLSFFIFRLNIAFILFLLLKENKLLKINTREVNKIPYHVITAEIVSGVI